MTIYIDWTLLIHVESQQEVMPVIGWNILSHGQFLLFLYSFIKEQDQIQNDWK